MYILCISVFYIWWKNISSMYYQFPFLTYGRTSEAVAEHLFSKLLLYRIQWIGARVCHRFYCIQISMHVCWALSINNDVHLSKYCTDTCICLSLESLYLSHPVLSMSPQDQILPGHQMSPYWPLKNQMGSWFPVEHPGCYATCSCILSVASNDSQLA